MTACQVIECGIGGCRSIEGGLKKWRVQIAGRAKWSGIDFGFLIFLGGARRTLNPQDVLGRCWGRGLVGGRRNNMGRSG